MMHANLCFLRLFSLSCVVICGVCCSILATKVHQDYCYRPTKFRYHHICTIPIEPNHYNTFGASTMRHTVYLISEPKMLNLLCYLLALFIISSSTNGNVGYVSFRAWTRKHLCRKCVSCVFWLKCSFLYFKWVWHPPSERDANVYFSLFHQKIKQRRQEEFSPYLYQYYCEWCKQLFIWMSLIRDCVLLDKSRNCWCAYVWLCFTFFFYY